MSLEKVVRPFQNGDVFNARQLPPSPPGAIVDAAVEVSRLSWEGGAKGDYDEGPPPWLYGFTSDWEEQPGRRVTQIITVQNPDDPDQHVELERIKKATFKNKQSGEEFHAAINWGAR